MPLHVVHDVLHGREQPVDDAESVLISYLMGVEALRKGKQVLMWLTKDGVRVAEEIELKDMESGEQAPVPGGADALIHAGKLVGLVMLAHPTFRRPLDWEDFDLFRAAGRQERPRHAVLAPLVVDDIARAELRQR